MSGKKRARNRKKRARRHAAKGSSGSHALTNPKNRHKDLFKVFQEVATAADRGLRDSELIVSRPQQLELSIFVRGLNALKSTRLLLEDGQWEIACSPARLVFELLVNVEYLNAAEDRDASALRMATYGLFQQARLQYLNMKYNQETGRPIDLDKFAFLEKTLEKSFPQFGPRSAGQMPKSRSWSGKSTRELAELSESKIRSSQYELLFSAWSEQVHGAPSSLIDSMLESVETDDFEEVLSNEDPNIVEVGSISLTLFLELWLKLETAPSLEMKQVQSWTERLLNLDRGQRA